MARIIGGVDPATDHQFSSVWNLNSDVVSQSFNDDTWPALVDANVTIKAWGAGGAGGYWNGGTAGNGGAGGFAKGSLSITPGTSIYIVVGAGGTVEGSTVASSAGGNGGVGSGTSSHKGGSGGGFAGVFLGSTASDVTQANALLIAGGGGGGGSYDRDGEDESGGGGGGSSGAAGVNSPGAGSGGTQNAGGTGGVGGGSSGAALQGGAGQSNYGMYAGGGGGGYYGGGGGGVSGSSGAEETGGGGGGSGFVKNTMIETVNLAGNNGTAGSTTGYQTTVNASADDLGSLDYGKGGGFNSPGYKGYVSITDGVGTRTFDTSQSVTIRDPNAVTVTAEVFGAGGAGGNSSNSGNGGNGGIVKASKSIAIGTVLKIVVGNGGKGWYYTDTGALEGNTGDPMRGGYLYSDESNQTGGGGGSGSGVFVTSVTHANAQVIAGGGGGGCGNNNADGGNSHTGTGATDSLNGSDGGGNATYAGNGADGAAGGAAKGSGGGAGAALIGGYAGTASSTAGGDYSSGGSGGGGYYGGGGANHGGSASEQGGGGAGSGHVNGTWTRLAATGMTPKAGANGTNAVDTYPNGTNGEVKITDGAGTTTYSTPGTFDHTVS